ncbi:MAG: ECF transporter S component [Oscillospiraceae bacterium]|nr:ECF transporter S component [Oscillospiraceae bacterium]
MSKDKLRTITGIGLLAAVAVVLVYLIRFPIFPAAPHMEYDPADIPLLIGALFYGTLPGLVLVFVACVIQALTVSAASGWMGFIMHFVSTGLMVFVASLIYQNKRTLSGAVIALIVGALTSTVIMIPLNLVVVPLFIPHASLRDVAGMLIPVIVPFNLIKSFGNCILAFILYKRVQKLL